MRHFVCLLFFILSFSLAHTSLAQTNDSTQVEEPKQSKTILKQQTVKRQARNAMLMSAIIPGTGQLYVGHLSNWKQGYWKAPIIWGLTGFFVWNIHNLNKNYQSLRKEAYDRNEFLAYNEDTQNTFIGNPDYVNFTLSQVETQRDDYRDLRDLNALLLTVTYVLNIFDAYVGVHMLDFKVSNAYIMSIRPEIRKTNLYTPPTYGVGITLNTF